MVSTGQSGPMDVDDDNSKPAPGDTTETQRPGSAASGTGSPSTRRRRRGKTDQSLTSPKAVTGAPPPPPKPNTGDTTQNQPRGTINTGKGPVAAPPPPPPLPLNSRGLPLPATPAPAQVTTKTVTAREPQSTPLPPSPAPTPTSKSAAPFPSAAQEKAKLAANLQAANLQAAPPAVPSAPPLAALNAPQPGGSHASQVVLAPKAASAENPFEEAEGSPFPPPSYADTGSAVGHMPQAVYQTNLASPGPGCFYVHTATGFVPIPNPPPPGIGLFILGADGFLHQAPNPSDQVAYPNIPASATLSPGAAVSQGIITTPAPDPAAAAMRAGYNPKLSGSPPDLRSPAAHARVDDDDALDYFGEDGKGHNRRPASISYESGRAAVQKATRQSSVPLTGMSLLRVGDWPDADQDEDLQADIATARKYVNKRRDLHSRLDEEDDDFDFLKSDNNLVARQQEKGRFDEDGDDLDDELPDHPPGGYHLPPHKPKLKPIYFYEENERYYEFTNFAPYSVTFRGKEYPTSEHLFQARKFLDHRPLLAEHIRRGSERPRFAFNEARKFGPETRPDWKDMSIEIMDEILELKFTQHNKLRRMLLDTGERYLVENAGKYDDFWGNGADGNGRNELGKALMRLRETLREREREAIAAAAAAAPPKGKGKGSSRR